MCNTTQYLTLYVKGTMKPKVSNESIKDWSKCTASKCEDSTSYSFEVELEIDADFGEPGAILVKNYYDKELYVETISLEGCFYFSCNSWIQPTQHSKEQRIFFSNKVRNISSFTWIF